MNAVESNQCESPQPQSQAPASDIIGYEECAQLLNIAVGTLYSWVSTRRIEFYRIGPRCIKFNRSKVLAWLEQQNVSIADRGQR